MLHNFFIENHLLILNSKYWQEVKQKIESVLKICPEWMYPFGSMFWDFWIQFFILQKKTRAKIMLTIFQIQHRKFSNSFRTTWLSSVVFCTLEILVRKIQLDVDVIVFFFLCLCCDSGVPLRSAFMYVLFKYSLRLCWAKYISTINQEDWHPSTHHNYNMFVTVKNISHSVHTR
jgi:hypothetical protein